MVKTQMRESPTRSLVALVAALVVLAGGRAHGKDYFLTIAGGYSKEGNQASLEANVLFFQDVLTEKHQSQYSHSVFFADGYNERADLQVVDNRPSTTPATDLLRSLYSFRPPRKKLIYRNHRVPNVAGALSPESIRSSLTRISSRVGEGDRVFVYVTAHGSASKGDNKFNTTINCWNNKKISAKQFTDWLDGIPAEVPTIMVMAQCYCGGFSHTIFNDSDARHGLSDSQRVGFFAQQHNLAAAGCRPDIDNEEEYSTYFWGALTGRSRNGKPIVDNDYNSDGKISLAEAHAYAVINSNTIDIPLRSTEALVRVYSQIDGYEHRRTRDRTGKDSDNSVEEVAGVDLAGMVGKISDIAKKCRPDVQTCIIQLTEQVGLRAEDDVTEVFAKYEQQRPRGRRPRFGGRGSRGGRRNSPRGKLREDIVEQWPELEDRDDWDGLEILERDYQPELLAQIQQLPNYSAFEQWQIAREKAGNDAENAEVVRAKFQRLVNHLELAVLTENLSKVAGPDIVKRYNAMIQLEESFFGE